MSTVICPQCGLGLPEHARFCARCGVAQTGTVPGGEPPAGGYRRPVPVWVLVLFWGGSIVPLILAGAYITAAISPPAAVVKQAEASFVSPQVPLLLLAGFFTVLVLLQVAAAWGLTIERSWARPLATVVCAFWLLTCVGIPLGVGALVAIWSGPARRPAPPPPPPAA